MLDLASGQVKYKCIELTKIERFFTSHDHIKGSNKQNKHLKLHIKTNI